MCHKCGMESWEVNEWCSGHPWFLEPGNPAEPCVTDKTLLGVVHPLPVKRPGWDDVWMALADNIARRSKCTRARVGAVIVDIDQNVVSAAYNGPPRNFVAEGPCTNWCPRSQGTDDPSPTYDDCVTAHAEANAIARSDYSRLQGGTIYISTSPCKGCAKIFANSGVTRVVYRDEAGRDYRNPQATREFLEQCSMDVVIYED